MFEEMVSDRNEVQFKEMIESIRIQHMKYTMSKCINAYIIQRTGILLFSKDNTSSRSK